jgi:alpha-N-arabinofuranosidase
MYKVTVNTQKKGVDISPTFLGIFFEDINYGADGGLYAELIQNGSFEFGSFKDTFSKYDDYFYSWVKLQEGGGKLSYSRENNAPLHPNNPHYLRVKVEEVGQRVALCNTGYGGISLKSGESYRFSIFLKGVDYNGKIIVNLEGNHGQVYTAQTLNAPSEEWMQYHLTLTTPITDTHAKLCISFDSPGTVELDCVSLFPVHTYNNRENGLRKDLVEKLKDLQPKFLRFPGGCIVEGKKLQNAYNWKDTVGPVHERKMNWNRWEEWNDYPYNQSCGLGFYEYFLLAEDLGAAPLPILNCGMSCQFQTAEVASDIEPFIQDALDLIEYANGDETTIWGAKRIEHGHKEPFNLVYLGVGNEQWIDKEKHKDFGYFEIYDLFRARIKEKHPDIELVTTSGPSPDGKYFDEAWEVIREKSALFEKKGEVYAELIDEHYYMNPDWFLENDTRYDNYPRPTNPKSCRVFAGEYACHTNESPTKQGENTLYAALCEAAFMTGLERNSDLVAMTSYAPLFAKTTNTQWHPDLIWFDNTTSYGSCSYYVQKMFGQNMGTHTLSTTLESTSPLSLHQRFPIYGIASKDQHTNEIIVKLVNIAQSPNSVVIHLDGLTELAPVVKGTLLTSPNRRDVNTLEEPTKVAEQTFTFENSSPTFVYEMPANSFVVLRLKQK